MVKLTSAIIYSRTRCSTDTVKKINLWGCEIDDISICKEMVNLQVLSLSRNKIKTCEPLKYCINLEELYLRGNEIEDFHEFDWLKDLKKLKVLWIDENPCTKNLDYRKAIVRLIPTLTKLDDRCVSEEDHGRGLLHEITNTPSIDIISSYQSVSGQRQSMSPSNVDVMSQSMYLPSNMTGINSTKIDSTTTSYPYQKNISQHHSGSLASSEYHSYHHQLHQCQQQNITGTSNGCRTQNTMTTSYISTHPKNNDSRIGNVMSKSMIEIPSRLSSNFNSMHSILDDNETIYEVGDDLTPTDGNYQFFDQFEQIQENGTPVDPIVNPLPNSGIESFTSGGISARQSRNYDNFNHSHQYSSLSKRKLNSRSYSMSPGRKNRIDNITSAISSLMTELDMEGLRNIIEIAEEKIKKMR
ncbi:Protein C21orf2 [Strongyloides ratti]|uniref:Protein C21orf2 n=1 Tax=Strongyloides ratti TaxID=34506 RepID=A0A090LDW5_STRRB|nr:Protein C21orf2 [Strongyloides ratti]CEF67986.1 Protein C21orf2 [Strongyloides ratti]